MDAELAALSELEAELRRVDSVGVAIAEGALPAVLEEARRTASAGTSPSGEAWARTKDGRAALSNAAAAITAHVSGTGQAVLTLVLRPPYVYHQRAKGKTLPRRQVLTEADEGIPTAMQNALERSARDVLSRTIGGRR